MPSGGTVHVSAMSTGDCVVIEVADTGGGLNETALGHLFEAFRGSRHGGTGLGLALARELETGRAAWRARVCQSGLISLSARSINTITRHKSILITPTLDD